MLIGKGCIIRHVASPDLMHVFAGHDDIWTADHCGKKSVQSFQVHGALTAEATENIVKAIVFGIRQGLCSHWLSHISCSICSGVRSRAARRSTAAGSRMSYSLRLRHPRHY